MQIFDKWKDFQTILDEFSVLVYPRKGFDYEPLKRLIPICRFWKKHLSLKYHPQKSGK